MVGGANPWTVTHSIYSAVLMNVESTMKRGAHYPARAYHDDVDFPHICEDRQLVAAKCQWLFMHKVGDASCMARLQVSSSCCLH